MTLRDASASPPRAARRRPLRQVLRALGFSAFVAVAFVCYLTQPLVVHAEPTTRLDVEPGRLAEHVRMLTTVFVPRDASHPEQLDLAAAYLGAQLAEAGGRVAEQPFDVGARTYRNVIASFGPEAGERVIVGAHYDAAGPLPGADDNASGVAGLLELARLLGRQAPASRVDLVAYTLEEPPHFRTPSMGSAMHASALRLEGVGVRAMMSLEMIGCFSDAPGSQNLPSPLLSPFFPSEGNFIAVVGEVGGGMLVRRIKRAMAEATPLPVRSLNAPRSALGVDLSDHLNFWEAGYEAVMVTDTAFFRNPRYHTAHDTADTLDYTRMAQVVQGVHAAVQELAR